MPLFKKTRKVTKELPKIDVIQNDITEIFLKPFPHQSVQNFLKPDFFKEVNLYLEEVLKRGIIRCEAPRDPSRFTNFPVLENVSYFQLTPACGYPMNQFMTKSWIDYFSTVFDLPLTNTVSLSFHHHKPYSKGLPAHTDYYMLGFPKSMQTDDPNKVIIYDDPTPYCSLVTNNREKDEALGLDVQMRACSVLLYLDPPFTPNTGGETVICANFDQYRYQRPEKKIPPIPNSITTFITGPNSYHTFYRNKNVYRNVLAIWFHTDVDVMLKRYKKIVPYPGLGY